MAAVDLILLLVAGYSAIGLIFAAAFVLKGAAAIDPTAAGAPWSFRLLIFPGSAALWPILARRWAAARDRAGSPRP